LEKANTAYNKRNYIDAVKWCRKAADAGHSGAITLLGKFYKCGIGVEEDYVKARLLFEKAENMGNADATVQLGLIYWYGDGVEENRDKARECWLQVAHINEEAKEWLRLLK